MQEVKNKWETTCVYKLMYMLLSIFKEFLMFNTWNAHYKQQAADGKAMQLQCNFKY